MKRILAALIAAFTFFALPAAALAEGLDFTAVMEDINAEHKALISGSGLSVGAYTGQSEELVSEEEAGLLAQRRGKKSSVTYAQAAADVDLYFRLLRTSYGGYYYFGGDAAFDTAKANVLAAIANKSKVSTSELMRLLRNELYFIKDAHFNIDGSFMAACVRYKYYYTKNQDFYKDDKGYFKLVKGEKWYFDSFAGGAARLELSLTGKGEIVYSPVLLIPGKAPKTQILLKNEAGEEKRETVKWSAGANYSKGSGGGPKYSYSVKSGIPCSTVRAFQGNAKQLAAFAASGAAMRGAKVSIVDLRGNTGGGDEFGRMWVQNYSGMAPKLRLGATNRVSRAISALENNGRNETCGWRGGAESGAIIPNSNIVIVLVDAICASAGESTMNFIKSMENTIVVGSNTAGYQMCGNVRVYYLPNTGISVQVPSGLRLHFDGENVDGKGYEPDIWCSPKTSLDAVIKMAKRYIAD